MTTTNLELQQGADFYRTIVLQQGGQSFDATGWTATAYMQIDAFANNQLANAQNAYVFATNISNNELTFAMWANTTSFIPADFYSYSVWLTNGTTTLRIEDGIIQVTGGVPHIDA